MTDERSIGDAGSEAGAGGAGAGSAWEAEPLAGEGTDVDEATVTQGPATGGATGRAAEGTTEEETGG